MGCPACVGYARGPFKRLFLKHGGQPGYLAARTHAAQTRRIGKNYRQPCRIVAPVFELPQPIEQDGHNVALAKGADDSAHGSSAVTIRSRATRALCSNIAPSPLSAFLASGGRGPILEVLLAFPRHRKLGFADIFAQCRTRGNVGIILDLQGRDQGHV